MIYIKSMSLWENIKFNFWYKFIGKPEMEEKIRHLIEHGNGPVDLLDEGK